MTDANLVRQQKIAANALPFTPPAYSGPAPIVIVGDSHVERMEQEFGNGYLLNGHPVLFAGIAGATFRILRDYIPWQAIKATAPFIVKVIGSINNAVTFEGLAANFDLTQDGIITMMKVYSLAFDAGPICIASDPPPDVDAGISPCAAHQIARAAFYAATINWGAFGWVTPFDPANPNGSGPEPSVPIPFVDLHSLMAIGGGVPASQKYSGVPSYLDPSRDMDTVHLVHQAYIDALAAIS